MNPRDTCSDCQKLLTDPVGRKLGIGPKCWLKKYGSSAPSPHTARPTTREVDPDQIPLPLEATVDAETRKAAVDTIARRALARSVDHALAKGQIDWGDYPDLAETVFDDVLFRVEAIAKSIAPADEQYQAAYDHLTVQEGQN